MAKPAALYSEEFHADRDARTRDTARQVLGMIADWVPLTSVCDVGCGVGTWLATAGELGATDLQGFEGPWGRTARLVVDEGIVTFGDLERPVVANRRFDLAISLEVAEHLTEQRAPSFVAELCALSDMVLFSAAVPEQGGTGHINEQWQSWWAGLFAQCEYVVFDPLRPALWTNENVPWWYRQNLLVYAREGSLQKKALAASDIGVPQYLDIVHPAQFERSGRASTGKALRRIARRWLSR